MLGEQAHLSSSVSFYLRLFCQLSYQPSPTATTVFSVSRFATERAIGVSQCSIATIYSRYLWYISMATAHARSHPYCEKRSLSFFLVSLSLCFFPLPVTFFIHCVQTTPRSRTRGVLRSYNRYCHRRGSSFACPAVILRV